MLSSLGHHFLIYRCRSLSMIIVSLKEYSCFAKMVCQFLKNVNKELQYDPKIPLLDIHWRVVPVVVEWLSRFRLLQPHGLPEESLGIIYWLQLFNLTDVGTEPQRDDMLKIRELTKQPSWLLSKSLDSEKRLTFPGDNCCGCGHGYWWSWPSPSRGWWWGKGSPTFIGCLES